MALIPQENMTKLFDAADVKEVANSAAFEVEKMQLAHAINNAANTGEHMITYNHLISDDMKTELEGRGYIVKLTGTKPSEIYEIRGF